MTIKRFNAITASRDRQQGVAIVMVLLIVAIATSLASYLAMQQNFWQRQVQSQFERAQARQLGLAGIDWARAVLAEDARGGQVDHEKEIWTARLPAIPVESGEVMGTIEDRQGLFNLNNVPANVAQFQRLLAILGLSADLAPALADWLDADVDLRAGGAEDDYYLALEQPYRAANRALTEIGELSKVKGFDRRAIDALRAFVSVLPVSGTPINVNFASAEVMTAVIGGGLSLSDARLLLQQRQGKPFKDVQDFKNRLPNRDIRVVDSDISVKSDFFWVTGRASVGQAQVITQALLQRASNWPTVIWQSVQ